MIIKDSVVQKIQNRLPYLREGNTTQISNYKYWLSGGKVLRKYIYDMDFDLPTCKVQHVANLEGEFIIAQEAVAVQRTS